ncbi:MAG TPA: hypothetical protein VMW87_09050 [Spirochaetia bacterium]|nr:hypothetical protein [Spirochaetia bacterium]
MQFQILSPFWGDLTPYFTGKTDIGVEFRYPLPSLPAIQPFARAGLMSFSYNNPNDPSGNVNKWSQNQIYFSAGAGYLSRVAKTFEFGADVSIGAAEAIFPHLDNFTSANPTDFVPRSTFNGFVTVGGHLGLDPSYNMSIGVNPTLTYMHAFSPLTLFNGFMFGIGFSGSFRYGTDPDSPQAIIRSIQFGTPDIQPVFSAMQSYYVDHPIGTVTIRNTENFAIQSVDVSFFQKNFMDSPTESEKIPVILPGETKTVNLLASFNDKVFTTQGDTPLNGEIQVKYVSRGRPAEQTQPASFTLHDRSFITWTDDRKVAAYITPKDSAVRNYASHVRQVIKNETMNSLSEPLQDAMAVFYALKELGCLYQKAPVPFETAQANPTTLDNVNLPRETLTRLTGDCSDLTVLYDTMLETIGIRTGFITVPGHIYALFDTGVSPRDYRSLNPDQSMTFSIDGTLWVPVEITLVGTSDFISAWRQGVAEWHEWDKNPDKRKLYQTGNAQAVYRPVALQEKDLGLQYGRDDIVQRDFQTGLNNLVDAVVQSYSDEAEKSGRKADYNVLGIVAAKYGRYAIAERAFNTALAMDRNYLNPIINLGNLYYLQQQYQSALRYYHTAEVTLSKEGRTQSAEFATVLLNTSQSYYELANYDRAKEYYTQLKTVDPNLARANSQLGEKSGTGRDLVGKPANSVQYSADPTAAQGGSQ